MPVIRDRDGTVAGVTIGRSNPPETGSHTIYVTRAEDVVELLDGIADVTLEGD